MIQITSLSNVLFMRQTICCCVVLWVVSLQHHVRNGGHVVKRQLLSFGENPYKRSALHMSAVARDMVRHAEQKRDLRLQKDPIANTKLVDQTNPPPPPKITVLLPSKQQSSYFRTKPTGEHVSWYHVFSKISDKIGWEAKNDKYDAGNGVLSVDVLSLEDLRADNTPSPSSEVLILVGIDDSHLSVRSRLLVQSFMDKATVVDCFNCSSQYMGLRRFGEYVPPPPQSNPDSNHRHLGLVGTMKQKLDELLMGPTEQKHRVAFEVTEDVWTRKSLDDLIFLVLSLVDTFTAFPVKSLQASTASKQANLKQFYSMCSKCRAEMIDCYSDETCRKAMECLNKCKGNDQVCSYRCISSHETETFERFAQCIIQENNILGLSASMPVFPDPVPLRQFCGQALSFSEAEDIFVGHLQLRDGESNRLMDRVDREGTQRLPWSWKVVCGQNPAYDYFACQHQLFYRDLKQKTALWYDPVFKVTTFDGREVWRRRHCRVNRGKVPGQFYFSVLDNGVESLEYWRIVDCADDLSWAVFYYSGAASAAGTSFAGALLVTPTGSWPVMSPSTTQRIEAAFAKGKIEMWELFEVNNSCCKDANADPQDAPPLALPVCEA